MGASQVAAEAGEAGRCLWRGAIDHGHPERPPSDDAKHGDEVDEASGGPQAGFLGPAAGFEDGVEDLDFPAHRIPAQHPRCVSW